MNTQYVVAPPSIPEFLYKSNFTAWIALISWANKEYKARLRYCAKRGYFKQWVWLHKNSSPIRILAEMPQYRKFCALLVGNEGLWDMFNARERSFIRKAFELRDLLKRSGS